MNQVIASGSVTPMSITTAIERLSRLREKVAAHFLLGVMLAADPTTIGN